MTKFRCQPEYYTDRTDAWGIEADDTVEAAEQFQEFYETYNPPEGGSRGGEVEVRVIHPDGREQVFVVTGEFYIEYTAVEKES